MREWKEYKLGEIVELIGGATISRVEEFNNLVAAYFNKIINNQQQIRTLTSLRDTLLPKLMSREVRVEM
ncbi:hypothetical protein LJC68_04450 [Bacteroidales bacterium OttesenSCG-928-B11]|nr:hypothetical protein [Bacteroidales bacterium OttesenSCG-928-C03]MDL2312109.1 hypothetical protein [Bacteroidales bacterium OttesenSCG-928-B11]MDL2326082.1 hypothetical protein [Bacteroidales bacterium OttesenSCG-928-A14]